MKKKNSDLVIRPVVKEFTVAQLRDAGPQNGKKYFLKIPAFQRWIVPSNKTELIQSIEDIGVMRCIVIAFVEEEKQNYIIDGNHMREIIVEDKLNKPDDKIACIYKEVGTYAEASEIFKLLNTKGKKLDWVDKTNLYTHVEGPSSIYADLWAILGNPKQPNQVNKVRGFTVPTMIEIICKDKKRYSDGEAKKTDITNYRERKMLLNFLLTHANDSWDKIFGKDGDRKPSGAAIIGAINAWFRNGWNKEYDDSDFLEIINEIYAEKQSDLKDGIFVINRDNAGKLLEDYMSKKIVPA